MEIDVERVQITFVLNIQKDRSIRWWQTQTI